MMKRGDGKHHVLAIRGDVQVANMIVELPEKPVDGETYVITDDFPSTTHLLYKNGEFLIHNSTDAAIILTEKFVTRYCFVINGNSVDISEMPCDDETKTYLMLKYSPHRFFGWFS